MNKTRAISVLLAFLCVFSLFALTGSCNGLIASADAVVRPGGSFTVRLSLESAAIGYEGYFSFDETVLSLTRVTPINSQSYQDFHVSTDEKYVRVTHYSPSKQMVQLSFSVSSKAAIGSKVTVRFFNGKTTDGSALPDVSCSVTVRDQKSSDATLESLSLAVYASETDFLQDTNAFLAGFSPVFSSGTTTYSVTVPHDYAYYRVLAKTKESHAEVSAPEGTLVSGSISEITIPVRAEDGTQKTYTLRVFREQTSYIPDPSSSEPPPESSGDVEDPSSGSEVTSEELSGPGTDSSSQDTSEESSVVSDSGSVDSSSAQTSVFESSENQPIEPIKKRDWTTLFVWIAGIGLVALLALIVRIFVLFRKKQFK